MAYITAEIHIPQALRAVSVRLYFPTDLPADVGNKVKGVITLLHGLGGSGHDWMHMTAACRYAADNGYVLVAPAAENSFYTDMRGGAAWHTILAEWLPAQLASIFRLPAQRECNYIAGLSMGGYGALRLGLLHPERYAAIGSFSGIPDMRMMAQGVRQAPDMLPFLKPVLGEELCPREDEDLFALARAAARLPEGQRPRILCTCGSRDEGTALIHTQNQNFRECAEGLPLDFTYREWDGVHEWNFWDRSLAEFIGFIRHSDYGERKKSDWAAEYKNYSLLTLLN